MSDYATKKDVQEIVDRAVTDLSGVIANLAQSMHSEIQELKVDSQILKNSLNSLTNTMDNYLKRLDEIEIEDGARDARFDRLVAWAREVSTKTGIPLKDL